MGIESNQNLWRLITAGALALFIAMGVGRFAYTPILPWMQSQEHFTNAIAGYLASSNYLGYLVGAFAAGSISWIRTQRLTTYRWSLMMSILTTSAMAVTSDVWLWSVVRMISGISSGLVFVLVSSIVLDVLARQNRSKLSGVLYGGVGIGIAVTGLVVPMIGNLFDWRGTWLGLTVLTILIGIPAALWIRSGGEMPQRQTLIEQGQRSEQSRFFSWLVVAYGFEGLGYIITGTFLVAMATKMPALHGFAAYCWVVVGVAALPSCLLWAYLGHRLGNVTALVVAYVVQATGILLPVVAPNTLGVYLGSILFGGTFMGITTLGTMLGRHLRPLDSSKAIGLMTGVFGVGQIIGAAGAGLIAGHSGGFGLPTLVASGVIFLGAAILLIGRFLHR